jgi:hypothetical protein
MRSPFYNSLRLFFVVVFLSSGTPAFSEEFKPVPIPEIINAFVNKYSQSEFAYALTPEEFQKALTESKGATDPLFNAQAQKVLAKLSAPTDNLERFHRAQQEQIMAGDANHVIDMLIQEVISGKRSVTDLNMLILTLPHDTVFESEKAGPLRYLSIALNNYHFSEDQLKEIRIKSSAEYRSGRDSFFVDIAVPVAMALGIWKYGDIYLKKYLPGLFKGGLLSGAKRVEDESGSELLMRPPGSAAVTAEKDGARSVEEKYQTIMRKLEAMESDLADGSAPKELQSPIEKVSRANILNRMDIIRSPLRGLQRFGVLINPKFTIGVYVGGKLVGGMDNLGHALYDSYYGNKLSDSYVNVDDIEIGKDLRSDYFDGLAVLNLSCKTRALLLTTQSPLTADQHLDAVKKLNSYYVDYQMYEHFAPRYDGKVVLPEGISDDPKTGIVTYALQVKDRNFSFHFQCDELKGSSSTRVEVNLAEALYDLMESYNNLKGQDPKPVAPAATGGGSTTSILSAPPQVKK